MKETTKTYSCSNKNLDSLFESLEGDTVLVYITDKNNTIIPFYHENLQCSYFMQFDDVLENEINHLTKEQAEKLCFFLGMCYGIADNIVFACDGGISRSVAIQAAFEFYHLNDDKVKEIFKNPNNCPNRYVFDLIFKCLHSISKINKTQKSIIDRLFENNTIEWRKNQDF